MGTFFAGFFGAVVGTSMIASVVALVLSIRQHTYQTLMERRLNGIDYCLRVNEERIHELELRITKKEVDIDERGN